MALGWLWWRAWFSDDAGRCGFWRGRRGTWRHLSSLCVAGVALMALGWLWWRLWFSDDAGRCGSFGVAGVALGDIYLHFAWQAWHLWHWAGFGGALGSQMTLGAGFWRGRRGTWRFLSSLCVAGVARMALGWLRWRAWAGVAAVAAAAVGVAGVALGDIHVRFTWQACYLVTTTSTLCGRRGTW